MKTTLKFIITFFFTASLIAMNGCASSEEHKESPADTTSVVVIDTVPNQSPEKIADEVISHTALTIIVKNLASPTAPVVVGIYKSKYTFLSRESRLKEYTFIPKGNTLTAHITDIKYGEIAVAVYQDMNSNGGFDKNFLGLPKEGYCFSNNFKPLVKAPCFNDCKFKYGSTTNIVTMNLIK